MRLLMIPSVNCQASLISSHLQKTVNITFGSDTFEWSSSSEEALTSAGSASKTLVSSGRLLDPLTYHQTFKHQPGWQQAVDKVKEIVSDHRAHDADRLDILEFGARTGQVSHMLADIPNVHVSALEDDPEYFAFLEDATRRRNSGVMPVETNIHELTISTPQDAVVGLFSAVSMPRHKLKQFLARIKSDLLKQDGILVVGQHFLAYPGDSQAHGKYMANLQFEAIKEGNATLAHALTDEWLASEGNIASTKMTRKAFEDSLTEAGLRWKHWRVWPIPYKERFSLVPFLESGTYVYKIWMAK